MLSSFSVFICLILGVSNAFKSIHSFPKRSSFLNMAEKKTFDGLGGKILVSGIGKVDEDEFMLNLLNEQSIWSSVLLATNDSVQAKKQFLSRTARYSGLLNILGFADWDYSSTEQVSKLLEGANSWIAFNVSRGDIVPLCEKAVQAGVKRVVLTTELSPANINETSLPEFQAAVKLFEESGGSFTGIRHGSVIPGSEDNPYEIVNATIPVLQPTVERGVLARVVAELLLLSKSGNQECGLGSSSSFAAAYLDVLRSTGLTRSQEVEKIFSGGIQRVARLTADSYEREKTRAQDEKAKKEKLRLEREAEGEEERRKGGSQTGLSKQFGFLDEESMEGVLTSEEIIEKRATEILTTIWGELDARMVTRYTSQNEFFDNNKAYAVELATQEQETAKSNMLQKIMDLRSQDQLLDEYTEGSRRQFSRLLNMERRELQSQKEVSDAWVKYIYLLLEVTMERCKKEDTLFYNLDEFGQTMLLREEANKLRAQSGIAPYEVIYDPLDAAEIVRKFTSLPIGESLGLSKPAEKLSVELDTKYGKLLKSVPALRGASQIIDLAIETLRKDLPPAPPTPNELRQTESQAKQEMVTQLRLTAIRNRGKPVSTTDNSVGKL